MAEPTQLGRYKLTKVLGRGAMGVVYEGLDPRLNRRVAIKTILKNAAIDEETSQMYSAQFAREAQAAGRLNHPNIVHVHDFAEEGEIAYLVMEYIQGRELRSYFDAKEKFELPEAVRIMGELLDALHFAHEAGIIHRDVKPANVMLDAEKRVKLADFGVARIQDSERSAAGTMVGTPAFMSPEQISGGKIDRRTDVFSAGVVLYQLLTGDQPFTGAGAWTVAKKIMQDDPPQPSSVVKSVSPAFDAIVHKALAKKPGERYASAREFATDLRAALGGNQPSATASLPPAAAPRSKPAPQASEAEVEFWKAIQNSTDAAEFEFYLEQFPEGTYAALARHKIARLSAPAAPAVQDTARLEAEAAERQRREAEAQAQREAAEAAKREAEQKARREAAEKARREAEEARRAAQAKAEAEARARAESEARARAEAEARAKKVAEELAQRQAAALARLKQQEEARKAAAAPDPDATVALARPAPAAVPVEEKKKSSLVPALIGAAIVVAGVGAFFALNRKPAPVAEAPAPQAPAVAPAVPAAPVIDEAKIRREVEERVRKEYADKSAAEQAAAAKAATEKALQEKQLAAKVAAEKAAAEKSAAEKVAAEKLATAKSASEKAALERAAAEKAAAEKAAAEKAAAEKAAAD
ncbi:MAG TPA: serine/threonine-protein kinase, partial [Burkholderiales bacterium]